MEKSDNPNDFFDEAVTAICSINMSPYVIVYSAVVIISFVLLSGFFTAIVCILFPVAKIHSLIRTFIIALFVYLYAGFEIRNKRRKINRFSVGFGLVMIDILCMAIIVCL